MRPRRHTHYFRNDYSRISGNTIFLDNLTKQKIIPEFMNSLKRLHYKFKHNKIILDLTNVGLVYPYPVVPIAGYIHYFKEKHNVEFEFKGSSTYLKRLHFIKPETIGEFGPDIKISFLDRIWKFENSRDVQVLVDGFIASLRKVIDCEKGVLDACTWGLNEIMDNVIQHSQQNVGFVMVQVHKSTKQISVCIFDYGIGIYESLRNSQYRPKNATDAISLSIQAGVTRDKRIGQGNGMWGLYNIISQNDGQLLIVSGYGGLAFRNSQKEVRAYKDIIMLSSENQSTSVNFQLKVKTEISMNKALGAYEMVNLYVESLEDEYSRIIYKIVDQSSGTGTRQSGERMRHEIYNIYNESRKQIIVDFSGVGIISSSFADEFIGKFIAQAGIFQFQNIVQLKNMNPLVQAIVQKSLSQRLAESLGGDS